MLNSPRGNTEVEACPTEVATDHDCGCRLRKDSAFFFRTRSQKFLKIWTRIRSHFSISAVAEVSVVISYVKPLLIFGCIACSRNLNRSRILKFENLPDPDPDLGSKILEQERSRSLEKWLWPPLLLSHVLAASEMAQVYLPHLRLPQVYLSIKRPHCSVHDRDVVSQTLQLHIQWIKAYAARWSFRLVEICWIISGTVFLFRLTLENSCIFWGTRRHKYLACSVLVTLPR